VSAGVLRGRGGKAEGHPKIEGSNTGKEKRKKIIMVERAQKKRGLAIKKAKGLKSIFFPSQGKIPQEP